MAPQPEETESRFNYIEVKLLNCDFMKYCVPEEGNSYVVEQYDEGRCGLMTPNLFVQNLINMPIVSLFYYYS